MSSQNGTASETESTVLSASAVKEELVGILEVLINDDEQVTRVRDCILNLESFKATPITPEFTEMALSGEWSLMFSSMRTRIVKNTVRIRKIFQRFDIDKKQLVNQVEWTFPDKTGIGEVQAVLNVICSYSFVGPGRLNIKLEQHKMSIVERSDGQPNELPDDLQAVIDEMRLALPVEFFDPSGLSDITYIEPDFRVTKYLGKRFAGVRNVLSRISWIITA